MKICILDPGLETHAGKLNYNLGDLIIQEAVNREVASLFPGAEVVRFSTHQTFHLAHLLAIRQCDKILVGGTNLLSSHMLKYRQWMISLLDTAFLREAILLGVGWWQYQDEADWITRLTLGRALSKTALHSLRDSYSEKMLRGAGVTNTLNTGCVTMWPFATMDQGEIPRTKGRNVLMMLTDYMQDPEHDKRLIELLLHRYENVYLWPQGRNDPEYVAGLGLTVHMLEHSFEAFTRFVSGEPSFDYIGTRLHGGVWCLRHRRRSLILEVDNRAREIARDTGLPTCKRDDLAFIERWIEGPTETKITMNPAAIAAWRAQFSKV